jgi:hypothetical protein
MIMGNAERPELGEELTNSFCATDPDMARVFARATFLSDSRDDVKAVRVPALVLDCAQDVIAPREVGAFLHQMIPGSTLITLDATGHCPHLSAPEATNEAITDFLAACGDVPHRTAARPAGQGRRGDGERGVRRTAGGQRRGPVRERAVRLSVHAQGRHRPHRCGPHPSDPSRRPFGHPALTPAVFRTRSCGVALDRVRDVSA